MARIKVVVPVAGLGTRFLPATKAIPKEMLPLVDKPAIQYVVEEAAQAGLSDIVFVTGKGKEAIVDHFDAAPALERQLGSRGETHLLELVRHPQQLAHIHAIRQGVPLGLGHAVLCARDHVGDSPFVVMLGDDLIDEHDPLLAAMLRVREKMGGSVVALLHVPHNEISKYGSVAIGPVDEAVCGQVGLANGDVVRVNHLVEKPSPDQAPSDLAVIGRYVLDPAVFDVLSHIGPGRGGEIQLTDALARLATMPGETGGGVHGVVFRGHRYDIGNQLDYLKAIVRIACGQPGQLSVDFREWLDDFIAHPSHE